MSQIDPPQQYWRELRHELWTRTISPAKHPSFVLFFLVAIVIIAPFGIWVELLDFFSKTNSETEPLRSAFKSFLPAFLAATCMQLIWAEAQRSLRAFSIFLFIICLIIYAICANPPFKSGNGLAILCTLTVALAMWMWWIANANQRDYLDDKAISNPVGGDNLKSPLSGDLSKFKTD